MVGERFCSRITEEILMSINAYLAAIGALVFATTLTASIRRLMRSLRESFEATVALKPEMSIELPTPGPKLIYFKGPRFTRVYGLSLSLRDSAGHMVQLRRIIVPLSWSGVSDVTAGFAKGEVPRAGVYTLTASGIPHASGPMYLRISRPNVLQGVFWLLGIVLSAFCLVVSLVLAIIFSEK
jgi:hypothetical protein